MVPDRDPDRYGGLGRLFLHLLGVAMPDKFRNPRPAGDSTTPYAATAITTRERAAGSCQRRAVRRNR